MKDPARLLAFYDRLRDQVATRLGTGAGAGVAEYLLVAPDLFILLVRLFLDRDTPPSSRALVGGALAYFLLPVDLMPEMFLGVGGLLDDVILSAAVLTHVFTDELEPLVARHWSGSRRLRTVLEDATGAADALLSTSVRGRLASVLARYGVVLDRSE